MLPLKFVSTSQKCWRLTGGEAFGYFVPRQSRGSCARSNSLKNCTAPAIPQTHFEKSFFPSTEAPPALHISTTIEHVERLPRQRLQQLSVYVERFKIPTSRLDLAFRSRSRGYSLKSHTPNSRDEVVSAASTRVWHLRGTTSLLI